MARRPPNDGASWSARELDDAQGAREVRNPDGPGRQEAWAYRGRGTAEGDARGHLLPCGEAVRSTAQEVTGSVFRRIAARRRAGGAGIVPAGRRHCAGNTRFRAAEVQAHRLTGCVRVTRGVRRAGARHDAGGIHGQPRYRHVRGVGRGDARCARDARIGLRVRARPAAAHHAEVQRRRLRMARALPGALPEQLPAAVHGGVEAAARREAQARAAAAAADQSARAAADAHARASMRAARQAKGGWQGGVQYRFVTHAGCAASRRPTSSRTVRQRRISQPRARCRSCPRFRSWPGCG